MGHGVHILNKVHSEGVRKEVAFLVCGGNSQVDSLLPIVAIVKSSNRKQQF